MVQRWTVGDLDSQLLFLVKYNQDRETGSRFSLPIKRMLDEQGEPLFLHPRIYDKNKGSGAKDYRFKFRNEKDAVDQGVKIDGSGLIMFMSPTDRQAAKIKDIVHQIAGNSDVWSPEMLAKILEEIYAQTGIFDVWNETTSNLTRKYEPTEDVVDGYFGRFVYKANVSSAIYLGGAGTFDGPAEGDQGFNSGAYIFFPGLNIEDAGEAISKYDPLNPSETRGGAKLVQPDIFLQTRRLLDGSPISPSKLQKQIEPKRRYYQVYPIAGFPDYEPEAQAVESEWIRRIQDVFSLHGYPRIKTRAVEDLSVLKLEEGDRNPSQIFELKSVFDEKVRHGLGLRYDHTVPLARFIAENYPLGRLVFPFKSARIGPVWRAQDISRGGYKEFVQADVDVVVDGKVPLEYDAEFPRIMCEVADTLQIGSIELGISNRKITKGFFNALGFDDDLTAKVIRVIEKRDALGIQGMQEQMYDLFKADKALALKCMEFASIKSTDATFIDQVVRLCKPNKLLEDGMVELMSVLEYLSDLPPGSVVADIGVVRGMNYYTGTVFEGKCKMNPSYPPIIVGGRYDNLVGHFMSKSCPGVGASFEVTRAMDLLKESGRLTSVLNTKKVIIAYTNVNDLKVAKEVAKHFRDRGTQVDMLHGGTEMKQMLQYAQSKSFREIVLIDGANIFAVDAGSGAVSPATLEQLNFKIA